jgi:hypothetical protein
MNNPNLISRRSFMGFLAAAPWVTALAHSRKIPVGVELYSVRNELKKDVMGRVFSRSHNKGSRGNELVRQFSVPARFLEGIDIKPNPIRESTEKSVRRYLYQFSFSQFRCFSVFPFHFRLRILFDPIVRHCCTSRPFNI